MNLIEFEAALGTERDYHSDLRQREMEYLNQQADADRLTCRKCGLQKGHRCPFQNGCTYNPHF